MVTPTLRNLILDAKPLPFQHKKEPQTSYPLYQGSESAGRIAGAVFRKIEA
jgi:hypothetical protein